jgi:hypothetical protein
MDLREVEYEEFICDGNVSTATRLHLYCKPFKINDRLIDSHI